MSQEFIDAGIPKPNPTIICPICAAQKAEQAAEDALKKAKEALDNANQKLGQLPVTIIDDVNKAIEQLLKIINGYQNPESPDFDPATIIAKITALLDPVVKPLEALPVPKIPGLGDIAALLAKLTSALPPASSMSQGEINAKIPKRPAMPTKILDLIGDLISALQSLAATLPMVLINMIFDCLNIIIGLFGQISGVIGVPSIPPPLSLVPQAISLLPDINKLVINLPGQMAIATKGVIQKKLQEAAALQLPDLPTSIPDSNIQHKH